MDRLPPMFVIIFRSREGKCEYKEILAMAVYQPWLSAEMLQIMVSAYSMFSHNNIKNVKRFLLLKAISEMGCSTASKVTLGR